MSGFPADVSRDGAPLDKRMFLQKPFSKADLAAKVRKALGDRH